VNKKVDGRRKRKLKKKHKGESRYRESTTGKIMGQKENGENGRAIGGIIVRLKLGIK
jgi:hypothetical protein